MKKIILLLLIFTAYSINSNSQNFSDTITDTPNNELKSVILDSLTHSPLPYASIYVMHKNIGAISNETGNFTLSTAELDAGDTVRIQYIGYKTKKLTIVELQSKETVFLTEDIVNLTETLIFGSAPDVRSIVKKVLKNFDSNYRQTTTKNLAFIRSRSFVEFEDFKLNLKKSSISQLDKEMIKLLEDKIPKEAISFDDFLGNVYHSALKDDTSAIKTDPIRAVSLKEKDIAELDYIEKVFEEVYTDIGEEEYWKVRTGIFSQKVEDDGTGNDSVSNAQQMKDSIQDVGRKLKYYSRNIQRRLNYSLLNDEDSWEFLHKTSRYNYTLEGGTRVNGEDVYIIDFTPKSSGVYVGRLYVSTTTYALIRADYEFDEGKLGRNIHLFGMGYTEDQFRGSIYFERKNDNYVLKYFSKKTGISVSFDRNVSLIKKKERFLFDKTLNEIKVGIDISMRNEDSFELLFLERNQITEEQFDSFKQEERMKIIYVDQFDDNLWKGFPIIAPTKKMHDYKKIER